MSSGHHPPIEIMNTEKCALPSKLIDQVFSIYVGLPYHYHQTDESFPVLYLLDANVTFSFIDLIRVFQIQQKVPHFLTIGIGYPVTNFLETDSLRQRDFTPSIDKETLAHQKAASNQAGPIMMGGAQTFLRFIREELKPFVSANYRIMPNDAAIFGTSYAGLFALYALFTQPDTFTKYLIGSPSIWWDDSIILAYERDFAAQHTSLNATIFTYVGSHEAETNVNNVIKLSTILDCRAYKGLQLKTQIFEGEDHMSVSMAAFFRGLREIYQPTD